MPRGIEAKLQDKFIALLKKENILHIKTNGGLSYLPAGQITKSSKYTYTGEFLPKKQKEGFADVIVFWYNPDMGRPETLFIEIKTDTGKLRTSQIEKFKELKNLNYYCYILRPKHWEAAKAKGKLTFEGLLNEMEKWNEFVIWG